MREVACGDFAFKGCTFVAKGDTNEEAIKLYYDHLVEVHAERVAKMTEEQNNELSKRINDVLEAQEKAEALANDPQANIDPNQTNPGSDATDLAGDDASEGGKTTA